MITYWFIFRINAGFHMACLKKIQRTRSYIFHVLLPYFADKSFVLQIAYQQVTQRFSLYEIASSWNKRFLVI